MEGNLGVLYICGEHTGGRFTIVDNLLGRKVRRICGAYDRIVVLVDAWEPVWLFQDKDTKAAVYRNSELDIQTLQDVKFQQIAVGKNHNVALSLDGQLFSWGQCGTTLKWSELGHHHGFVKTLGPEIDDKTAATAPHCVITAPKLVFRQVVCGEDHSAAVTDTGDLYTWGRNFEGQLGHVFKSLSKETNGMINSICAWPKYVKFFYNKPRVVTVCCGNTFTAVLLADGRIYLLGGKSLRLNSIDMVQSTDPYILLRASGSNNEHFVDLASGTDHIIAVTNAGEMFSWGFNFFGQLGQGDCFRNEKFKDKSDNIVASNKSIKWAKVFAGGSYSAALTTKNQLYTWGNGRYGKLGHGVNSESPSRYNCEFAPRCVEHLHNAVVTSVLCEDRNLCVFAPTTISNISPTCGDYAGGYELKVRGSGFWSSENVTVRFLPLTDGQLLRGTLGEFCETTGEVVCQVPTFRLMGEYVVEVAMDGKNFTSNGRVFTVFKRPQIVAVSAFDAQAIGGEELTLSLCGHLPLICQRPIVRFMRCCVDKYSDQLVTSESEVSIGVFDNCLDTGEDDLSDVTDRQLRLTLPPLPFNDERVVPYTLEISYDEGVIFTPVCIDPTLPTKRHIIYVHTAQLVRVIPNSFLIDDLPHTITLELSTVFPPEAIQLLVTIEYHVPNIKDENNNTDSLNQIPQVSATLSIDKVSGNFVTCTIPPLPEWNITPAVAKAQHLSADWWKKYAETGFVFHVQVSMNAGRTFLLPHKQMGKKVFGMPAPGRLLSIFPNVGIIRGGTQVSINGNFFHFDTQDATVKLKWKDHCVVLPANCLQSEELTSRRVLFRTPPFPFYNDKDSTADATEDMTFELKEEVEVFVALDGEHYTDASLPFTYCAIPEICGITPQEAEPGMQVVLQVKNLIATSSACVKLDSASSKTSRVVPVKIDGAAQAAEFVLPELSLECGELVRVLLSLDGQEFYDGNTNTAPTPIAGGITFRYKVQVNELSTI
ncbi:E3 ubiquitin protein ligase [Plasmopara halstedii]|uniref:E3 ubiquitin protein ligase n=1 Tax=Plasmopara halstedii TaxID=4781 RepID=A0A0P1AZJ6_PLAHL|nr:E3 ubiquitin protein ligase [Plasmopara halstedii]CEG47305.1 E3 ubiquitin protein ligase [Plasmopara halstedii]|eukprot:XP_024583674.1 E3 ubiquitin protein ligase [Plasmopara halstedii]